jgi:hypothetical protein
MWSKHRRKVPICSIGKGGKTRELRWIIWQFSHTSQLHLSKQKGRVGALILAYRQEVTFVLLLRYNRTVFL